MRTVSGGVNLSCVRARANVTVLAANRGDSPPHPSQTKLREHPVSTANSSFDLAYTLPGPPSQVKSLCSVFCTWDFTVALALAVLAWLYVRFFMTEGAATTDRSQCLAEDDAEGRVLSTLISVCSCVSNEYSSD